MSSNTQTTQTQQEYRYDAFISYRHVEPDRGWAKWLHNQLETYTLPSSLQKKLNLPARLERVFRDEEELPVSSSLSAQIDQALSQSRFLIVICSPNTPESKWVNQEIVRFREMGRHDRILALLIEGEPGDAFPPALREIRTELVDQQTGETEIRVEEVEPLAADVRLSREEKPKTLKQMALLRILAMLHGCRFDDLRQRHQERAHRRMRQLVLAALALVVVMAGLATYAFIQQRVATEQRNLAEARDFDSRSRLSSLLVAEGWRHIDANNNHMALPFFVQAYLDDPHDEADKSVHRTRIGSLLANLPRLSGALFSDGIRYLGVLPDGMHALVSDDESHGVYSFETARIIHRFTAPSSFLWFGLDSSGEHMIGIDREAAPVNAMVVRLSDGAVVLQAPIDTQVKDLFMLPNRVSDYLPEAATVLLAGHFESSHQLFSASQDKAPAPGGQLPAYALSSTTGQLAFVDRATANKVQFRDLRTQRLLDNSLELPRFTTISDLAWSSDGRFLAVAASGRLWVYRLDDGAILARSDSLVYGIFDVFFSADDTMIALRGVNGTQIVTPDSNTDSGMRSIGVSRVAPWDGFQAKFAFDDNVLINASLESVQLQRVGQGLTRLVELPTTGMANSATISDASGDEIRVQSGGQITSWRLLNQSFGRFPLNRQGTLPQIVDVSDTAQVVFLDRLTGKLFRTSETGPQTQEVPIARVELTAVSPSGRWLAVSDRQGRVVVIDQHDSNAVAIEQLFLIPPTRMRFVADQQLLIEAGEQTDTAVRTEIHSFDLTIGSRAWWTEYPAEVESVVLSPDGKHLFVSTAAETVAVLDSSSGELLREIDHGRVLAMHVTGAADSARLVLNSATRISVFSPDGATMRSSIDVPMFGDFIASTAVPLGDSNRLIGRYIGKDSHLRLFDLTSGDPVGPKMRLSAAEDENIERFAVSHSGELIVAVGARGSIRVWSGEDGSVVALPFQVALSEFTVTGSFATGGDILFSNNDQAVAIILGNGLTVRSLQPAEQSAEQLQLLAEAMSMQRLDEELGLERLPMETIREHFRALGRQLRPASQRTDRAQERETGTRETGTEHVLR